MNCSLMDLILLGWNSIDWSQLKPDRWQRAGGGCWRRHLSRQRPANFCVRCSRRTWARVQPAAGGASYRVDTRV